MKNEFGAAPDQNGYSPTIMQTDGYRCALCGRSGGTKLDRHEPWGGANRQKSKRLGMWVRLCHFGCHEGPGSVHGDAALNRKFRAEAQQAAMEAYGWSVAEFIRMFGKSEIAEADTPRADDPAPAADCGFRVLDSAPLPF